MRELDIMVVARLPARLTVEQTSRILGFAPHDIPVLIKEKLLKPLGNPAPNAPKFFPACEIEELARDQAWLNKATRVVSRHWKKKNERKPSLYAGHHPA